MSVSVPAQQESGQPVTRGRDVTLIHNLSNLVTPVGAGPRRSGSMRELRVVANAAIAIRGGRIAFAGKESDLPPDLRGSVGRAFDAGRGTAIPGFVDTHTHLPFAGYRESEFNRRLEGETYQQIAAGGGGIASTVRSTRAASREELTAAVIDRAARMVEYGTTTAEAKSGYGLNLGDELKQLESIRDAAPLSAVRLVPTCLAAHDFPAETRADASAREAWVDEIMEVILPAVAERNLARFNDVFIEEGVFSASEGERILRRGLDLGLTPRVHADELSDTGGAALAAGLGAASADHLMHVSTAGIAALAGSSTVANLLPGTSFFLMAESFAPARELIDQGAIVSLSTDCNPGSSMTESMQIIIQLACLRMRMTVEEALTAATLHGAVSLGMAGEVGTIEEGKRADIIVLDAPSHLHLVYHFGVNLVAAVFRDGIRRV